MSTTAELTLKQAKRYGYRKLKKSEYSYDNSMRLKGHTLYHDTAIKQAMSKTAWKREGMRPIDDNVYHCMCYHKVNGFMVKYAVYRNDQVKETL